MVPKKRAPLISVIIPALRYDSFLSEAVHSILSDGWGNLQVVVVLDGPSEVPPDYFADPRVLCLSTGYQSGAARAINLGISESQGDFVARLDADDVSYPGRLARQVAAFEDNPSLLAVGARADLIDSESRRVGSGAVPGDTNARETLLRRNPFVHSSVLFSRGVFSDIGFYDESCIRMQDYELLLRVASRGDVFVVPETLVGYRVHGGQNSRKMIGFIGLMLLLSKRKRALARVLGRNVAFQTGYDIVYSVAQLVRYKGFRKPKYLANIGQVERES